ncbi:endonuclease [Roseobacter sp. HKCCD9010]|uniref:endonuclease/exonuclease/phosphatase family protein n=1 Tax=unclassified Roseobacter TaxID=196798 RepID=UPI001490D8AA|nr:MULTISPECIES: endonuclease/exonuclease/phosphatase family protein [unclassified Roseobacter]MBF9048887.1 endonuclease [Rhodobacterales bacterium HKCCD4356]NNV10886.1 endonuclease [Roseobacter sp. HKCCD7357]NNV15071.1 endonuclease [Roseobacter sp. HKCCD8768]NNV24530.1 endonuclease [Roseobacter sp. HKCCD8192]NNV28787.1 endonuclease [Roseobacter sp. HKCCD9061]
MRIATYNVEWFANLFDDEGRLLEDDGWSGRQDVTRNAQIAALGYVFQALDADAVMVVEAPDISRHRNGANALEGFAKRFGLRARKALAGFSNETQQELILLHDPDVIGARHDPLGPETGKKGGRDAPRFDSTFRIDLDIDATEDLVRFSKPPLEAALETPLGPIRLIGVHIKSKAPHGARDDDELMRVAIANRRKQLAQCIWLRARVEQHLAANDPLIVLGDFNDGPGLDEYKKLFGRSGVEIVLGKDLPAEAQLYDPHAAEALQSRIAAQPTTARFYIDDENRYLSALLDYVMVSPGLRSQAKRWRIWHPFDDPVCWHDDALCRALLTASDHFPVVLELAEAAPVSP